MPQAQTQPKPEEAVGYIPELTTWLWGGPPSECMEAIELYPLRKLSKKLKKVVLLNALVIPKTPMVLITMPTNIENVREIVEKAENIESYIGHEATAQLLTQLLGVTVPANRSEYAPQVGDIAIVVRLKKRLQMPQDIKDVKAEDLEFHVVKYDNDWVLRWYE
jgi:hypothetical protein